MRSFLVLFWVVGCLIGQVPCTVEAAGKRGTASEGGSAAAAVQAWATALQARDAGKLQTLMAPEVRYSRLELVGTNKLKRWGPGGVTPDLFVRSAEVAVVKVRSFGGEAVGILSEIVEEGPVRQWESWLMLTPGGPASWQVAHIADVAIEGTYPGDPEGCPETGAKRHETITLYGKLEGLGREQMIRIFQTRRDTDAVAFATGAMAEEAKKCTPKPGLALEDLEVVVQETRGALLGYHHMGRVDRSTGGGRGITLYTGAYGGALVAGGARIYPLPGGREYLFLGRSWVSEASENTWRAVHRVDAFRWEGGAFRKVWGFDFGKESGGPAGGGDKVAWSLTAPTADGVIMADLAATGGGSCSGSLNFTWAGGSFKTQKVGLKGPCLGHWWPGGESSVLGMGEVNLDKLAQKAAKADEE